MTESLRLIYNVMKESVYTFCKTLAKTREVEPKQMAKVLINLAEMNGYGKLELIKLDYKEKQAIFHMRHLPSELLTREVGPREKLLTRTGLECLLAERLESLERMLMRLRQGVWPMERNHASLWLEKGNNVLKRIEEMNS